MHKPYASLGPMNVIARSVCHPGQPSHNARMNAPWAGNPVDARPIAASARFDERALEQWMREYVGGYAGPSKMQQFQGGQSNPTYMISTAERAYVMRRKPFDNVIIAPLGTRVAAVLDWELSTLGDPLADCSYLLMQWELRADGRNALGGLDLGTLGIPTRDEALRLYCQLTGREQVPDLNWYFAFNMFRLVGIVQGIRGRLRDGNATGEHAAAMAARTPEYAQTAWHYALRAGA
jgi:aminoglycoside phosphotransferase (APT) family kinase protein